MRDGLHHAHPLRGVAGFVGDPRSVGGATEDSVRWLLDVRHAQTEYMIMMSGSEEGRHREDLVMEGTGLKSVEEMAAIRGQRDRKSVV